MTDEIKTWIGKDIWIHDSVQFKNPQRALVFKEIYHPQGALYSLLVKRYRGDSNEFIGEMEEYAIEQCYQRHRYARQNSITGEIETSNFSDFRDHEAGSEERIEEPDNPRYEKLKRILTRAYNQAASGKGKDRHSTGQNFEDQPMLAIQRLLNSSEGPLFQAVKKIQESTRLEPIPAIMELLGAINYIAGAIIYIEEGI